MATFTLNQKGDWRKNLSGLALTGPRSGDTIRVVSEEQKKEAEQIFRKRNKDITVVIIGQD